MIFSNIATTFEGKNYFSTSWGSQYNEHDMFLIWKAHILPAEYRYLEAVNAV